jgi:Ca2+-binding RTX toxin-like protein
VVYGRATGAVSRVGTVANETLFSGDFNDTPDGRGGRDSLFGRGGDDFYIADQQGEASDRADEGVDTVRSSVSYTLGANLENLVLTGEEEP